MVPWKYFRNFEGQRIWKLLAGTFASPGDGEEMLVGKSRKLTISV